MTETRDIERLLDAWLGDDGSMLPDRVIDASLAQIDTTPQRRVLIRVPWRVPGASTYASVALAATVVIAVGAIGLLGVQVMFSPPFLVSLGLAALIAVFVVRVNRKVLELDQMFPEVMRVPGVRFFVGARPRRETAAELEREGEPRAVVPPGEGS